MEVDLITAISSLGVGAVFGIVAFLYYRTDRKQSEDRWVKQCSEVENRMSSIIKADQESREKNTTALVELITWLKQQNGRH